MKIAVVIPALDEAAWIAEAVASAKAPGVEVLVVDGGSHDDTAERARAAGARTIASPPGRARQLEAGAREAAADVLVFLHADTRLPRGFDAALRRVLADPLVVGGAFALRFDRRGPTLRMVEWGVRLRVVLRGSPYGDQALFVRRRVLDAVGGVPQAPIMEDLDLVKAMRRHGRLVRIPLPVVTSARRYLAKGVFRSVLRNRIAAAAWLVGIDRRRIAAWYGP